MATVTDPPFGLVIDPLLARLRAAGCVAAAEEAALIAAAAGSPAAVERLAARRLAGEPLAWVLGWAPFAGLRLVVHRGVYVPRPHSEQLALRAAARLPAGGVAADLCTGCGAVAAVLAARVPDATVRAGDIDAAAVRCARANGVDAAVGDLAAAIPADLAGHVDVLTACAPDVPDAALATLPRDVLAWEPRAALAGGPDGLDTVRRIVAAAPRWLRPGGALLVELGGDQPDAVRPLLARAGFVDVRVLCDEDGDARAAEATLAVKGAAGRRTRARRGDVQRT